MVCCSAGTWRLLLALYLVADRRAWRAGSKAAVVSTTLQDCMSRVLSFLRSQHCVAEGCAVISLSLAVRAASELSCCAADWLPAHTHTNHPVQAHRHHSFITG